MYEPNLERVAEKMVGEMLRVQPGEHVIIEVRSDAIPFAETVALQCFRAGATATLFLKSDELQEIEIKHGDPERLAQPAPAQLAAIDACQHYIIIGASPAEPQRFQNTDARVSAAREQRGLIAAGHLLRPGRKLLALDYPTRYMAEAIRMPWTRFYESFWKAASVDYSALATRVATVAGRLEKARELRLTTPRGTNLHMLRGSNRPILRDDGHVQSVGYLPAGSVSFAPLEESVNGRLVVDSAFHQGQRITELEFNIEEGIVTPIGAATGFDLFMERWNLATGDKNRIGTLGIGLNEEVRHPSGFDNMDTKVFGMIQIGLGENSFLLGGTNHSTLHWEMFLSRPTLIADDDVLLQNGQLIGA